MWGVQSDGQDVSIWDLTFAGMATNDQSLSNSCLIHTSVLPGIAAVSEIDGEEGNGQ